MMNRRLIENHEAMLALIRLIEQRVADGTRSDPAALAKGRFAFSQRFGAHNALIERCLRSLPADRLTQVAKRALIEHGERLRLLRLDYSKRVSRWPLDTAMADWNRYMRSSLKFHALIKDHMVWEQEVIFPLISRFLNPAAATGLLSPGAVI
jgi:hemerythrin-like domain-containing protein